MLRNNKIIRSNKTFCHLFSFLSSQIQRSGTAWSPVPPPSTPASRPLQKNPRPFHQHTQGRNDQQTAQTGPQCDCRGARGPVQPFIQLHAVGGRGPRAGKNAEFGFVSARSFWDESRPIRVEFYCNKSQTRSILGTRYFFLYI